MARHISSCTNKCKHLNPRPPAVANDMAVVEVNLSESQSGRSSKFYFDEYVVLIRKRFPKYIFVEETKCNILRKKDSVLFRKEHYNEYCFLEYTKGCDCYSITLFKSNWKGFEEIEGDFLEGISFAVTKGDLETIMNCVV